MNKNIYKGEGKIPLENGKMLLYAPSDDLKEAVNLALLLGSRPLLLTGEPGVGKTLLAKAIAHEWYGENIKNHYFEWNIKSSSKAQEGLYRYDALRRLRDAQMGGDTGNTKLGNNESYFQRGALANAIQTSVEGGRSVLLIDEIDKADIDFPNDLLHELDKYEFTIPETGEEILKPNKFTPPLIIITSNQEKELPPAFLRRCIYFHIDFPTEKQLQKIMQEHFTNAPSEELSNVVKNFIEIRNNINKRLGGTDKKVSTSELVDWYMIIYLLGQNSNPTMEEKAMLAKANEWIAAHKEKNIKEWENIPFYQVLFKNIETRKLFIKLTE